MASASGALAALLLLVCAAAAGGGGTPDGSEEWGYVEVRPKAHMFWWLYHSPQRVDNGTTPWPTVLWLQGGPGASGVGYGNFMEIGPLDEDLKPRATTWLAKADLLFVDNPVGTGFSYVEGGNRQSLMARTDGEAARDLVTLLCALYRGSPRLRASPLYIVAESYGGKFAVTTALAALSAVDQGRLRATLAGVALGDSWISPLDFVLSWGPLLYQVSRVDEKGLQQCNSVAAKIKEQLEKKQFTDAEASWSDLENVVSANSNSVNFYNFLKDELSGDSSTTTGAAAVSTMASFRRRNGYSGYLKSMAAASSSSSSGGFDGLMNTVIKKKLGIIPKDLNWGDQSDDVFVALEGDFMKPRIEEVDQLLKLGVNVTIYNGQLDLICATKGTMDWVHKLKWDGLNSFLSAPRTPIYCDNEGQSGTRTQAFVKSYKNLNFYWILEAGHMVPIDNPCPALKMLADITRSPAK
ncbi:hypothetical protein BDA96_07G178900 [Sorghum bicolor]|uniref:Carboxypeptidase n=1 Tax=Sorghum bicolor TaxID=4558 RepID=A0A921QLC6_SORBI|nr:hypothetical protein BDA96_07G178900 [Sorghum bicolor]